MSLTDLMRDPALRQATEARRRTEKIDKIARERRSGPSPLDTLEAAAADTLADLDARRPSPSPPGDTTVDTDDLDPDLHDVADAHRRRLRAAIDAPMVEDGYADLLAGQLGRMSPEFRNELLARDDADPKLVRRFGGRDRDVRRVLAELRREPATSSPAKAPDELKAELAGEAAMREAAEADLAPGGSLHRILHGGGR